MNINIYILQVVQIHFAMLINLGGTGRQITERIKDSGGRDHALHIVKRNIETSHTDVNTANFKITDMNSSNNKRKRKIANSSWIKELRPTLNVQEKSIPLKLFNYTINNTYCNHRPLQHWNHYIIVYCLLPW